MIRTGTIVWLALVGAASVTLFRISQDVDVLDAQVSAVEGEIASEREAIRILRAEWAYLNRPARLRELAADLTDLQPVQGHQIVLTAAEIPLLRRPDGRRVVYVGLPEDVLPPPVPQRHPAASPVVAATGPDQPNATEPADGAETSTAVLAGAGEALLPPVLPGRRPDVPQIPVVETVPTGGQAGLGTPVSLVRAD